MSNNYRIKYSSKDRFWVMVLNKLASWSSQLEAFAQQYLELEKTMKLFQTLLHQDVATMNSIGLKFLVTDLNIAKLW